MTPKDILTWAAVVAQCVAAVLWLLSTIVKVSAKKVEAEYQKVHGPGSGPFQIVDDADGSDFIATLQRQVRWNRSAALMTGLGMGLQATATAL